MMDAVLHTYYRRSGIKFWWLDCDEPCDYSGRIAAGDRLLWRNGSLPDILVGAQYPAAFNRQVLPPRFYHSFGHCRRRLIKSG